MNRIIKGKRYEFTILEVTDEKKYKGTCVREAAIDKVTGDLEVGFLSCEENTEKVGLQDITVSLSKISNLKNIEETIRY